MGGITRRERENEPGIVVIEQPPLLLISQPIGTIISPLLIQSPVLLLTLLRLGLLIHIHRLVLRLIEQREHSNVLGEFLHERRSERRRIGGNGAWRSRGVAGRACLEELTPATTCAYAEGMGFASRLGFLRRFVNTLSSFLDVVDVGDCLKQRRVDATLGNRIGRQLSRLERKFSMIRLEIRIMRNIHRDNPPNQSASSIPTTAQYLSI